MLAAGDGVSPAGCGGDEDRPSTEPTASSGSIANADPTVNRDERRLARLTRREREVFELLVDGFTSLEVARRLGLSFKTIGSHRQRINRKLGTHSPATLLAFAYRARSHALRR